MKPTLFFGVLLLAVLSGAIAGILAVQIVTPVVEAVPVEPGPIAPVPSSTTVTPVSTGEPFDAHIERLSGEIEELRAEVAGLRAGAARSTAVETVKSTSGGELDPAAFVARHKFAILEVIEADREAQAQKRAQAQAERDLALTLARAERVARAVGLSRDQQQSLADVYALENAKRDELLAAWRADAGVDTDERAVREWRIWRDAELSTRFGPDLAQKIKNLEQPRSGGRRRGNRPNANGPSAVAPAGD